MRFENWPTRLNHYLAACEKRAFAWGDFDCALFAAGAVLIMTGVDYAAQYRGRYDSALGAARLLPNGLSAIPDGLNFERCAWAFARRGDIALIPCGPDDRESLGVVLGERIAVPSHIGGLAYFPTRNAVAVWRVD